MELAHYFAVSWEGKTKDYWVLALPEIPIYVEQRMVLPRYRYLRLSDWEEAEYVD